MGSPNLFFNTNQTISSLRCAINFEIRHQSCGKFVFEGWETSRKCYRVAEVKEREFGLKWNNIFHYRWNPVNSTGLCIRLSTLKAAFTQRCIKRGRITRHPFSKLSLKKYILNLNLKICFWPFWNLSFHVSNTTKLLAESKLPKIADEDIGGFRFLQFL